MLTSLLLIIWIPVNLWGYKQLKCLHFVWKGETRQKAGTPFHPLLQFNIAAGSIVEQFMLTHLHLHTGHIHNPGEASCYIHQPISWSTENESTKNVLINQLLNYYVFSSQRVNYSLFPGS